MKLPRFGNTDSSDQDEGILAEQGYAQELQRDWSVLHNFGVSFSIIVSLFVPFRCPLPPDQVWRQSVREWSN